MHILIIPNSYFNSYEPMNGIFFKEQAIALSEHDNLKIGVVSSNFISFITIFNKKKIDFGIRKIIQKNINGYIYQIFSLPKLVSINRYIRFLILKHLIKKYIKNYGLPDIVHVHVFYSGKSAIWLKKKYGVPYVVTEHFSVFAQKLIGKSDIKLASQVYKNSNVNIAVSNKFCKLLKNEFNTDFKYIPNVINTDLFSLKPNNENNNSKIRFINVASLVKVKNHELLITAFNNAFGNNYNYELIIIGGGVLKNYLQNKINDLNLSKQVKLLGELNQLQIKEELHKSDYFVLSSSYETFGVALIEALSCGLPALSTKCGGPEDIITNSDIGILCETNNVESLTNSFKSIINIKYDKNLIRNYALNNFSKQSLYDNLIDVYNGVLNKS